MKRKFTQALQKAKFENMPPEVLPTQELVRQVLNTSTDPRVREVCNRLLNRIKMLHRLRDALRLLYKFIKGPIQ